MNGIGSLDASLLRAPLCGANNDDYDDNDYDDHNSDDYDNDDNEFDAHFMSFFFSGVVHFTMCIPARENHQCR